MAYDYSGNGITSSAIAAANGGANFNKYAIGVIENADLATFSGTGYTTFGGLPVDATAALVRATFAGDANLDGKIDAKDYALINKGFLGTIPNVGWLSGDFNGDTFINADDFAVIDFGYLSQGTQLSFASPTSVPEPTGLTIVAATCGLFLNRRKCVR